MITQIYKKTIISNGFLIYFFDFVRKSRENKTYRNEICFLTAKVQRYPFMISPPLGCNTCPVI